MCIKIHCYGIRRKENRKGVRNHRTLHNHSARSGHFARLRCGQAVRNVRKGNTTIQYYPSEMSKEFQYLHPWSERLHGAIQLLQRLKDGNVNLLPSIGKDSKIYSNALYSAISDIRGMQDFLEGKELHFKDHQMDKKGKLISCVAYFQ